jgi:hypothetical protein
VSFVDGAILRGLWSGDQDIADLAETARDGLPCFWYRRRKGYRRGQRHDDTVRQGLTFLYESSPQSRVRA